MPKPLRISPLCFLLLAPLTLAGCDKSKDGEQPSTDGQAQAASEASEAKPEAKPATNVAAPAKLFEKDQRKKGCEMLPPAMVAKALALPEPELEQMTISGCIYTWESADESQSAEASLMSITVRKDQDAARTHFENATKSQTAEQLRAQMGEITKAAKNSEEIDTKVEKQATEQIGGMLAQMIPEAGYTYEDVEGVGDAARVLTHDGSLTVRVGNMVFSVRAYQGAAQPKPDLSGVDMRDPKSMMALAKQMDAAWMEQTRDVRRQQAIVVAKAIVAGL